MNILLQGIDVITCDTAGEYIRNADIGIRDGYIEFIHPSGTVREDFSIGKIINGRHKLAMPGLVNAHTHCGMTLLRNAADDLPLERWLFERVFPLEEKLSESDIYWGTLLGIAEMLKSGTTAMADMYLHMDGAAQAVCEAGIRANLSRSPLDFKTGNKFEITDAVEKCRSYHKNWHGKGNGRIKVYVEVHSTYLFDRDSLKSAAILAKELGTGIHTHILETQKEREDSFAVYGMSPVELCAETGILGVPVIAAHCVHLSDMDMDILNSFRVNIIHNPTSNLKLGSGVARVPEMAGRGLNIALGTDGAASNNNLNMFEEMHLASLIHKGVHMNSELVGAGQAVMMATANGAEAIGFAGVTGCLRAGMKADIIILDTDKPHFHPMNDPKSALVYSAQGADVDTVIVDGSILMECRVLKTIDEEKVKYEADRIAEIIKK